MLGLAADDAAERDDAVIGQTGVSGGFQRDRRRHRNFERARHRDRIEFDARHL